MKKTLLLATIFTTMFNFPLLADNEQPININQLPQEAQTILKQDFHHLNIASVEKDKEVRTISYEVKFANGASIEFDKKGRWTEIDFKHEAVPAKFIPNAIQKHVENKWPEAYIVKIERESKQYEIELSSNIEITYNKNFKVIDIDK